MTSRAKDVLLAAGCILGIQLLNWPASYFSTVNNDWAGVFCLFIYWALVLPAYFAARRFSKGKGLFWGTALGTHILFSLLSRWEMEILIGRNVISGFDSWNYVISWTLAVDLTNGALLLDLLILGITSIAKRFKNRERKEGDTDGITDGTEQ